MARKPFQWVRDDEEPLKYSDERPNRTKIKRANKTVMLLAETLIAHDAYVLDALPLDADVRRAIDHAHSIKSAAKAAKRRQLSHVAALLRASDHQAVADALGEGVGERSDRDETLMSLERWRDRLIAGGDDELAAFVDAYEGADRQQLRQAVRQAQAKVESAGPNPAAKRLFKLLRESAGV